MGAAALITWIVTAAGGFILLLTWLNRGGLRQQAAGASRFPTALILGHFLLAAVALVLWIVYLATDSGGVAWTAFAILLVVAVLGFTMLARWLQGRRVTLAAGATAADGRAAANGSARAPEQHFPVAVVVLHGLLAATTLVLVLLTALGVGDQAGPARRGAGPPAPAGREAHRTGAVQNGGMKRVSTTVVALAGERARACLEALQRAANVRTVMVEPERPALDRAAAAWGAAQGTHIPYLLHDADPLEAVAGAWVRRFDAEGIPGELEVAVGETLARWRAHELELPDYYLVLDAEELDPTRRHWYLGFLHRAAPSRVLPTPGTPAEVGGKLASLASGRWWPDLDRLLDGVDRVVPDQA
jgi:hypothetical protein